jgi:beta-N-acetylhexosaminidase
MAPRAFITGLSGLTLTADERAFLRETRPWGLILFKRNIDNVAQVTGLVREALGELGGDAPVLIDQEGGRVARLKPPAWPSFPAAGRFAALYEKAPISAIEAARVNAQAIAVTLAEAGVNVDCLPVLDVRQEGADDIIGDRALGAEPMQVAALGRAMLDGLAAGGVAGVVKHIPGHGRAHADSHKALPVVDASADELAIDIAPFRALRDAAMAMVAHILYPAWDAALPASISPVVIEKVIRREIGFDGLLMTDDLAMKALTGSLAGRASAAIAAGCDVALHCSGVLAENEEVAGALDAISDAASARLERAMAGIAGRESAQGYEELAAKRDALLAYA